MTYSSKDFNKTTNQLKANVPNKLIHKNVCLSTDDEFNSERNHPVHIVDVDSQNISMTIGKLSANEKTNKHRHTYETIIYVQSGHGYSLIENQKISWQAGDAIYIPVWAWHYHHNQSDVECCYIACENTPMLQNLGLAIRQEE